MYSKMFRQMYEGSLVTKGPWQALVTFQQFIVLADKEGIVDMTPEVISATTSIPLEIIKIGISALQEPDPHSRTPDEEGRRIMLLDDHRDWGWWVVNYHHYRLLKREEDRREYQRQYWHKRKLNKSTNTQQTQPISYADAESEAKAFKSSDQNVLKISPEEQIKAKIRANMPNLRVGAKRYS